MIWVRMIHSNKKMEEDLLQLIQDLEHQGEVEVEPRHFISHLGQEELLNLPILIQMRSLKCSFKGAVEATYLLMNSVNLLTKVAIIPLQKCLQVVVREPPRVQVAFPICSRLCKEELQVPEEVGLQISPLSSLQLVALKRVQLLLIQDFSNKNFIKATNNRKNNDANN